MYDRNCASMNNYLYGTTPQPRTYRAPQVPEDIPRLQTAIHNLMETMNSHNALPPECAMYILETYIFPLINNLHRAADAYNPDLTLLDAGGHALEHDLRPLAPIQVESKCKGT